jgi:hypothetical protein
VPVYRYAFGQDVRYLLLGEFEVDGRHFTVVCTLESGKGNMVRTGLHWIVVHHEGLLTEDRLLVADASAFVRERVDAFCKEMAKASPPIWMDVEKAHEMCRVAKASSLYSVPSS